MIPPGSLKWFVALACITAVLGGGVLLLMSPDDTSSANAQFPEAKPFALSSNTIGFSVQKRPIEAYTFGTGKTNLLFVGGMHGGYEWNSVLLAYSFVDHLKAHPEVIPTNISVTVIPSLNPDGVFKVTKKAGRFMIADVPDEKTATEAGRFNAHEVDLNRNFDCKWQPESTWRAKTVSAGSAAFSEPESAALRDFVLAQKPAAVVFWHSQANAVYASECKNGILPDTRSIMNAYAKAAEYPAVDAFDSYEVTGDAEGWLASIGTPAITVELKTHENLEWEKNLAGFKALLSLYTQRR
ncbi:MAG: M14 family metallopeptidase [Patescibacteria group bacterium]